MPALTWQAPHVRETLIRLTAGIASLRRCTFTGHRLRPLQGHRYHYRACP